MVFCFTQLKESLIVSQLVKNIVFFSFKLTGFLLLNTMHFF